MLLVFVCVVAFWFVLRLSPREDCTGVVCLYDVDSRGMWCSVYLMPFLRGIGLCNLEEGGRECCKRSDDAFSSFFGSAAIIQMS